MVWPNWALGGADSAASAKSPLVIRVLWEATAVLFNMFNSATVLLPLAVTMKKRSPRAESGTTTRPVTESDWPAGNELVKGSAATNCGLSPAVSVASQRVFQKALVESPLPTLDTFQTTETGWPAPAVAGALI